jgi:hypothetical protein
VLKPLQLAPSDLLAFVEPRCSHRYKIVYGSEGRSAVDCGPPVPLKSEMAYEAFVQDPAEPKSNRFFVHLVVLQKSPCGKLNVRACELLTRSSET